MGRNHLEHKSDKQRFVVSRLFAWWGGLDHGLDVVDGAGFARDIRLSSGHLDGLGGSGHGEGLDVVLL